MLFKNLAKLHVQLLNQLLSLFEQGFPPPPRFAVELVIVPHRASDQQKTCHKSRPRRSRVKKGLSSGKRGLFTWQKSPVNKSMPEKRKMGDKSGPRRSRVLYQFLPLGGGFHILFLGQRIHVQIDSENGCSLRAQGLGLDFLNGLCCICSKAKVLADVEFLRCASVSKEAYIYGKRDSFI